MTKKALSLKEFTALENKVQFNLLHKHGVYVGKRKIGTQIAVLFQLHGFYVEVHYIKYRKQVDHVVTSDSADILHPYLDQIKVKGLNDKSEER